VAVPWWTIHELHLGCTVPGGGPSDGGAVVPLDGGGGALNPNRANWTATAMPTHPGDVVTNAFDGVAGTRWASGKSPQDGYEWFRLDLGQPIAITQVWLTSSGGDYPTAYELAVSSDDILYTPVARGLGRDHTQNTFPTQSDPQ